MTDTRPEMTRSEARAEAAAAKARSKSMRPWYTKKRFILPLALVLLVLVISVTASGRSKKTTSTTGAAAPAAAYGIGQTAKTGDVETTVYGAQNPYTSTNQFDKPGAGNHFVTVDVQVRNPGSKQLAFSSALELHLLDAANHQYTETIVAGVQPGPPDGQIAAGQAIRGFVAFEVPDTSSGLKLRVQGGLTASGAVFNLT